MRKKQGVTLMEIMISAVMLAILASAFTFVFFIALKNWNYQMQRLELREPAIWALENMSRDLRQARSISAATAAAITVYISPYETINYSLQFLAGNWRLLRTSNLAGATAVAKNVTTSAPGFTLNYYNASGTQLIPPFSAAQLNSIRLIMVTLTIYSQWFTNPERVILRTQVRPRNL